MLDITSDTQTLGKPALSDFRDGKTTLPYIYLYENLEACDKEILKSYFKKDLNEDEISWIKNKFKEFNIIEKSLQEAKEIASLGIKAIGEYENEGLINVMKNMVDREF